MTGARFACPSDCGHCCTHLKREASPAEMSAERAFRDELRSLGVYHCSDAPRTGLALSPAEAAALQAVARERGLATRMHPRVWLLETRRRAAVVLEWHLPHEVCPFYADYKCTAYEHRPLLCRAYPVMQAAPAWALAPACPLSAETAAAGARGEVRLGSFLVVESRARRAVERRHAALDEDTMRLLESESARFARDLPLSEAKARLARYRQMSPEEYRACTAPARS